MDTVCENTGVSGTEAKARSASGAGAGPASAGPEQTTQTNLAYSSNVVQLHPGDQRVLLRLESTDESLRAMGSKHIEGTLTQHCILVGSLVSQAIGLVGKRLVWIDIEDRSEGRATIRYIGSSNVTGLPTWVKGPNGTPHDQ